MRSPADHPLRTIPEIRAEYDTATGEQFDATKRSGCGCGAAHGDSAAGQGRFRDAAAGRHAAADLRAQGRGGRAAFELYKLLDLGDHIGVTGYLFRTRTNELTIHVETITFLAKALLALPEKYHGLADVELRYRQRYVDS